MKYFHIFLTLNSANSSTLQTLFTLTGATCSIKSQFELLIKCTTKQSKAHSLEIISHLKQFEEFEFQVVEKNEIEVEDLASDETRTTLMIRNIPNKFTPSQFKEFVDSFAKNEFDFLYLRMDFKNKCNVGYAFINLIDCKKLHGFIKSLNGHEFKEFNSEKKVKLSWALIQGRDALVKKFRNSSVMLEEKEFRPKLFYTKGDLIGQEEPFPTPENGIYRPKVDVLFCR